MGRDENGDKAKVEHLPLGDPIIVREYGNAKHLHPVWHGMGKVRQAVAAGVRQEVAGNWEIKRMTLSDCSSLAFDPPGGRVNFCFVR